MIETTNKRGQTEYITNTSSEMLAYIMTEFRSGVLSIVTVTDADGNELGGARRFPAGNVIMEGICQ